MDPNEFREPPAEDEINIGRFAGRSILFLIGLSISSASMGYTLTAWLIGRKAIRLQIDNPFDGLGLVLTITVVYSLITLIPAIIITSYGVKTPNGWPKALSIMNAALGFLISFRFIPTSPIPTIILMGVGWVSGYVFHLVAVRFSNYIWRRDNQPEFLTKPSRPLARY